MSQRTVLALAKLTAIVGVMGVGLWLTTRPGGDGLSVASTSVPPPEQAEEMLDMNAGGPRPQTRHEFARALAKLQEGMTERQVLAILGKPDDIRTHTDAGGISAARTREVWRYGTTGHLTFPTLGSVHIDTAGKVQYVYGGRDDPPDPAVLSEDQLRPLLRLIGTLPSHIGGYNYNPRDVIRIVNALHLLGKEKALAVLAEYLRVASTFSDDGCQGRDGVFLILRVLFDVPTYTGHMPHMLVGAPVPPAPEDLTPLPRFPILLHDDVPLLLVEGYNVGGLPEPPERHLEFFRNHGVLRSKPLNPGNDPLALMDVAAKYVGRRDPNDKNAGVNGLIASQLLALIDTVYRRKADDDYYRFWPKGDADAAWKAIVADIAKLNIRWDSRECRYTFPDGTHLPDPIRKEYRRHIWKIDGLDGEAELILERQDENRVWACFNWSGKDGQRLPACDLSLSVADGEHRTLNGLHISSLNSPRAGSRGTSPIFKVEIPEGTKVQARLTVGNREQLSPVYTP